MKNYTAWFHEYAESFYTENEYVHQNIVLKEEHTLRVCKESADLCKSLDLDARECETAGLVALLHDIARFEQFHKYKTFKDKDSRDHGDWGAQLIDELGILHGLALEEQKLVTAAVRLHNKFILPQDLDERTLLHCNIIRDADKIDIFHVITSMDLGPGGLRDKSSSTPLDLNYNPILAEKLLENKNFNNRLVHTHTDMHLLQLTWVFDLNYHHTFVRISEQGYIDALLAKLPNDKLMNKVRDHMKDYMKKH